MPYAPVTFRQRECETCEVGGGSADSGQGSGGQGSNGQRSNAPGDPVWRGAQPRPRYGEWSYGLGFEQRRDLPGEDPVKRLARLSRFAVVDPSLVAEVRQRQDQAARRGGGAADVGGGAGCALMAVGALSLVISVIVEIVSGGMAWWIVGSIGCAVAGIAAAGIADGVRSRRAQAGQGAPAAIDKARIIAPSELDQACRGLLDRARKAISDVLASEVYQLDFLDKAAGEATLRAHEWEIASLLRDITGLRAEHAGSTPVGPMTAAVLDSQKRALALAQDATESRVSALERYATQVRLADVARTDWETAKRVSGLNDRYLDLVARTAADPRAIEEIAGLTEQAAQAARVFQESLAEATTAGLALVLPTELPESRIP